MTSYIVTARFFPVDADSPEQAAEQIRDDFKLDRALLVEHEDGSPIGEFDEDSLMILPSFEETES